MAYMASITSLLVTSRASLPRPTRSKLLKAFLQLPPSCRAFSATPRPRFLETAISPAYALFEGLHSITGLPWAYTLPLAALSVRTILVLPISIYTRQINQKQAALQPTILAWTHQLKKEAMRESGHLGPAATQATLLKKVRRKRNEIYKRWGCSTIYNTTPLLQLPIFLVAVEALRMMSGYNSGLLGALSTVMGGESVTVVDIDKGLTAWYEPGFESGGALWFPDLTKPDPELRLSFILSGSMLLNLFAGRREGFTPTVWQTRFTRSLGLVALAVGPLLCNLPSSMLIYWISSSLLAQGQALVLDKLMPIKQFSPPKPRKPLGIGRSMVVNET